MFNKRDEWRALRGVLGVFALCALLAAGMLTASNFFWREKNLDYQANFARFREASRRYLAVDDEERVIEAQYPAFKHLYARGIIGQERRLSWVEALNAAGAKLQVPEIDYRIDAQKRYTPEMALESGPFEVNVSDMQLSLGLLHEGDLTRLLAALTRDSAGLFSVEQCEVTREGGLKRARQRGSAAARGMPVALVFNRPEWRSQGAIVSVRAWCAGLLVGLWSGGVTRADDLGRLFFTPQERVSLDVARLTAKLPPLLTLSAAEVAQLPSAEIDAAPPPLPSVTVNGIVTRSQGPGTLWMNGSPQDARQPQIPGVAEPRIRLHRAAIEIALDATQPARTVKAGQIFDPARAEVREAHAAPRTATP